MSLQCLGISDLLQSPSKGYFDSHPKMRVSHKIETRVHLLYFAPPPPPKKKEKKKLLLFSSSLSLQFLLVMFVSVSIVLLHILNWKRVGKKNLFLVENKCSWWILIWFSWTKIMWSICWIFITHPFSLT